MKIDVEGMELYVLQGGTATIRKSRPVIYCENDRVEKSENLIEYLWELDYKLYWHIAPLYNPNNYFGYASNVYGNVCAFNMLCIPKELSTNLSMPEITDKSIHPLKR